MFLLDSMATGITAIPLAPTYIRCSSWIMWPRTFLCGITTFILITSPTIKYVLLGSCGQDNLLWNDRMFRLLHGQSTTGAPMLRRPLMIQLLCLAFMFRGRRLGSWSWLHWKGILILRKDRFPVQVMVGFPMARKRGSPNHWATKMLGSVRFAKEVLVLIWWHGIGNVVDIYIYSWGSWEYIWDLLIFVLWKIYACSSPETSENTNAGWIPNFDPFSQHCNLHVIPPESSCSGIQEWQRFQYLQKGSSRRLEMVGDGLASVEDPYPL